MKDWQDLDTLHADILRPQFRLVQAFGKIRRTLKRQALIRTGINHCIGRYGLLARGNQETAAHALVLSGFSRPPEHQTVFLDQR